MVWKKSETLPDEFRTEFKQFPGLIAQLLYNVGVRTESEANTFLSPKYEEAHSPFEFFDMQKAVTRLWEAVENQEKIVIYGDYDADAVTAVSVLIQTFRHVGYQVSYYIPDRFSEGYGLNIEAFRKLKAEGATVVITVDCGTNSVDIADFCHDNGIDLIITDHHEITGELPRSYALINPKNPNEKYPEKQITGVGVAFKLAKAFLSVKGDEGWEKWLLDLVAIGTVADVHSLRTENRILVSYGLKVLAKTKWPGLSELIAVSGADTSVYNTETIGFTIAPRINAAGRLEHASLALELLVAEDRKTARELAEKLEKVNTRRKNMTARIVSEAREMVLLNESRKVLVLAHESWHKGLVGIVAGKLAEEFSRPVVVLEKGETEATGSVRTHGKFNTVEALTYAKDTLLKYGGHKEAAGLSLKSSDIEAFTARMLAYADENDQKVEDEKELLLAHDLNAHDLTIENHGLIEMLAPFGAGNPEPVFGLKGVIPMSARKVGKTQNHLQATFILENRPIESIGFSKGFLAEKFSTQPVDLAVQIIKDSWGGREKLKLKIIDAKV